jgi:hypothetical protein
MWSLWNGRNHDGTTMRRARHNVSPTLYPCLDLMRAKTDFALCGRGKMQWSTPAQETSANFTGPKHSLESFPLLDITHSEVSSHRNSTLSPLESPKLSWPVCSMPMHLLPLMSSWVVALHMYKPAVQLSSSVHIHLIPAKKQPFRQWIWPSHKRLPCSQPSLSIYIAQAQPYSHTNVPSPQTQWAHYETSRSKKLLCACD